MDPTRRDDRRQQSDAYSVGPRRTSYDKYHTDRARGKGAERSNDLLASRNDRPVNSTGAQTPLNVPTAPAQSSSQHRPSVVPASTISTDSPGPQARSERNWGGKDGRPTPSSPSASIRDQRVNDAQNGVHNGDSNSMDVDHVRRTPSAPIGTRSPQSNQPGTCKPVSFILSSASARNGPSSASATRSAPSTPLADATPSIADGQAPNMLYAKWLEHQEERDVHLMSLLMAKLSEDSLWEKIRNLDSDQRGSMSGPLARDGSTEAKASMRQSLVDEHAQAKRTRENYQTLRHKAITQSAETFATAIKSVFQAVALPSRNLELPPQHFHDGPSAADFAIVKSELEDLKNESRKHSASMEPSAKAIAALNKDCDDVKSALREIKTELSKARQASVQDAVPTPRDFSSDVAGLQESVKSLRESMRGATTNAQKAKDKAEATHSNLSRQVTNLQDKVDEVEQQIGEVSSRTSSANRLDPSVREELRKEFSSSADLTTVRSTITETIKGFRTLQGDVGAMKTSLKSYERIPSLVENLATNASKMQKEFEASKAVFADHNGRLEDLKKELGNFGTQLEDVKAVTDELQSARSAEPPSTAARMDVHRSNRHDLTTWNHTHQTTPLPSTLESQDLQKVYSKMHKLELWLSALSTRMDQQSMFPQMKAMLKVMAEQIPQAPQILQDLATARGHYEEIHKTLVEHRHGLLSLADKVEQFGNRIEDTEKKLGENKSDEIADVKTEVEKLRTEIASLKREASSAVDVRTEIATLKQETGTNMDVRKHLDTLDSKVEECEVIFKKLWPALKARLQQLDDILDKSNINRLLRMGAGPELANGSEALPAGKVLPAHSHTSDSPVPSVPRRSASKVTEPPPPSGSRSVVPQARTFSARQSSLDDGEQTDDEVGTIPITSTAKYTSNSKSASTAANATEKSSGLRQALFTTKRQKKGERRGQS